MPSSDEVARYEGGPLAILSDDGKLCVPVSAGMPANTDSDHPKVYVEQAARVDGLLFEAGGAMAIQFESIERT
jgi:hypothetical protein